MEWFQLLALIGGALLIWWLVRSMRSNPEAYSRANLSKSFSTMGFLALMLIAFVAFCIWILRS